MFAVNGSCGKSLQTRGTGSAAPSGQGRPFDRHLGLKPQAESLSPFGTKFVQSLQGRFSSSRVMPNLNEMPHAPHSRARARGRWLARINIRKQISQHRFRSRFGFLDGELDLIIDFFLDLLEIIQVRVTAD
jgi:hypothetical protein